MKTHKAKEMILMEMPNYAGLRQYRRARSTGTLVGLYNGDEAGMDTSSGDQPWSLVCEPHGFVSSFETIRSARSFASCPEQWCEVCSGDVDDEGGHT